MRNGCHGVLLPALILLIAAAHAGCASPPPVGFGTTSGTTAGSTSTAGVRTAPQAREGTLSLDLDTCIQLALENHASGKVADADLAIAESRVEKARSAYWPRVTLTSQVARLHEDPSFINEGAPLDLGSNTEALADAIAIAQLVNMGLSPQPGNPMFDAAYAQARQQAAHGLKTQPLPDMEIKLLDRDAWNTSLEVAYPLFTGGKITAVNEQADIGVEVASSRKCQTDEEIALRVHRMYLTYQFLSEVHRVAAETQTRFEVILDITERLYQTGSGTVKKTDYLKTKVFTSTVRGQVKVVSGARDMARSALLNAIGLDPSTSASIPEDGLLQSPRTHEAEDLLHTAFRHRQDWRQVNLGLEAAGYGIDAAESEYWPQVYAFGRASHMENSYDKGVGEFLDDTWALGLQVEVSLFNGFATSADVRKAEAERTRMVHLRRLLEQGIRTQVDTTHTRLRTAADNVESARQSLDDARENRELNVRAYEAELVETQAVIEAQLLETFTRIGYFRSLFEHGIATAEMDRAIGKLLAPPAAEKAGTHP